MSPRPQQIEATRLKRAYCIQQSRIPYSLREQVLREFISCLRASAGKVDTLDRLSMTALALTIPGFVQLEELRDPRPWEPSNSGKVKATHRGLAQVDATWLGSLRADRQQRERQAFESTVVTVEYTKWEEPDAQGE
jgi:hypothetical protein